MSNTNIQQIEAGSLGGRAGGGHNKDNRNARKTGKYSTRRELILATRAYKKQDFYNYQIALKVGVSEGTVQRILNGDPRTTPVTHSYNSTSRKEGTNNWGNSAEEKERPNMKLFSSLWRVKKVRGALPGRTGI